MMKRARMMRANVGSVLIGCGRPTMRRCRCKDCEHVRGRRAAEKREWRRQVAS